MKRVLLSLAIFTLTSSTQASAAPAISNISQLTANPATNEKVEFSLNINTTATNTFYPYDPSANSRYNFDGESGITVNANFADPQGNTHLQPAFYYQDFDENVIGNSDWFYPTENKSWRVRFSPHLAGNWSLTISAQDSSGTTQSQPISFSVSPSDTKGFVKVSPHDSRYFMHSTGEYFPSLGYNMNYRHIDWINPSTNTQEFQIMSQNGIQLTRTWLSQWSIFGAAWSPWRSRNPAHRAQEPDARLRHNNFPSAGQTFQSKFGTIGDSDTQTFLWLSHDETIFAGGSQWNYNPCMMYGWETPTVPTKPSTTYQISIDYKQIDISTNPRSGNASDPHGLTIKTGRWIPETEEPSGQTRTCEEINTGTVITRTTSNSDQIDQWQTLAGTFTTEQNQYFMDFLYLALENVTQGNAFIKNISIRELQNGQPIGPELFPKPSTDYHEYIDQRNSYSLDKVLDDALAHNIYLKLVISEKQDFSLNIFEPDGSLSLISPNGQQNALYFGLQEDLPASRWLQRAWWRYLQARWGHSPNIHSWELLNEGPDNNTTGHWDLAEEMAEYLTCGVFGQDDPTIASPFTCSLEHPNAHLATTSFYGGFMWNLWNNFNGSDTYNDIDYADFHKYVYESTDAVFNDAAASTITESTTYTAPMPIIRGEVGWRFASTDLFNQNASDGLWLHNMIWAGMNAGGLIEHYWVGSPTAQHIYNNTHDHRDLFGNYYKFIKDIPLHFGGYIDAEPIVSNSNLRVVGQKNTTEGRAHLWIQNTQNTWRNIHNGITPSPQSANITLSGFSPNSSMPIEFWDTKTGSATSTNTITVNNQGEISVSIPNLITDTAIRIGDYTTASTPPDPTPPDLNQDSHVNLFDLNTLIRDFASWGYSAYLQIISAFD